MEQKKESAPGESDKVQTFNQILKGIIQAMLIIWFIAVHCCLSSSRATKCFLVIDVEGAADLPTMPDAAAAPGRPS